MIGPGTSTHTALPWPRDDNAACPERGAGKCSPPEEKCPPALLLGGWAAICNLKDAACHSERRKSLASLSCPKLGLFLITLSKALQLKPLLVRYLITSHLRDLPETITTAYVLLRPGVRQGVQSARNKHIPVLRWPPQYISEGCKHSLGQFTMTSTQLTLPHCMAQIEIYSPLNSKFNRTTFSREAKFH